MHAAKRLRTIISIELGPSLTEDKQLKPAWTYINNVIFRTIVGATFETNVTTYKNQEVITLHGLPFLRSDLVVGLINEHHEWLKDAFSSTELKYDTMFGVLSEKNIQQKPHLFIAYQLFLAQRLELMRQVQQPSSSDPSRQPKATFQIIPQLTMKRRCVTFGKNQTTELIYHLAQRNLAGDFISEADIPSK